MKIATYNINGINGRLQVLLRWLKEAGPDIVCLQELKSENNKFPKSELKEAGYHAIWQGQKSWNGVAILAKSEIKELRNDCRATTMSLRTAGISKRLSTAWSSAVSTCPMATPGLDPSSITNCAGSSGWPTMRKTW
jgi:exonuclease III